MPMMGHRLRHLIFITTKPLFFASDDSHDVRSFAAIFRTFDALFSTHKSPHCKKSSILL